MATLGNLIVNIGANLAGLKKGLNEAQGLVGNVTGKFSGLGGAIKTGLVAGAAAGVVAVGALGAGLAGVAASSVSAAMTMDQQVSNIAAVMGKSKDEIAPLKDLIFDLSLNPNLTVDATQAADAIEMLAKNGLSMEQILNGAAESTVQLANATGADFSTAADVATDVMALFNISAENMGQAVDGITGVTTNSKFGINDYALALGNAGGVAAGMGVDIEDLNAVLVGTSSSFAAGAEAGTSFKTFLQRMANPTDEMKTLMDELGISLFDAQGNMRPMGEVVGQLNQAMSGMTEAQKANVAATLGGADAARMVIALSQMSQSEYEALSQKVNAQGQAAESAATRVDSLQGAWAIFLGIIDAIKLQIGDALLPAVRTAVEQFSEFATVAGPLIVDKVKIFGEYLATVLMPLLLEWTTWLFNEGIPAFWAFAQPIIEQVVPALATLGQWLVDMAVSAWPLLNAAIQFVIDNFYIIGPLLGVVGIALLAISSPITVIIGFLTLLALAWSNNWGGIQEKTQAVIDFVTPYITQAMAAISGVVNTVLKLLSDWWAAHGESVMALVKAAFDFVSGRIKERVEFVQAIISAVLTFLQIFWATWGAVIMANTQLVWDNITTIVKAALDILGFIIDAAAALIRGDWSALGAALMSIWRTAWDTVQSILSNSKQAIDNIISKLVELVQGYFTSMKDEALAAAGEIKSQVIGKFNDLKESLMNLGSQFKEIGGAIVDGIGDGIKDGWGWLKDLVKDVANSLFDAAKDTLGISSPSKPFMWISQQITKGLGYFIERGKPRLMGLMTDLAGGLDKPFEPVVKGFDPKDFDPKGSGGAMTTNNEYHLHYHGSAPGNPPQDLRMIQAVVGGA